MREWMHGASQRFLGRNAALITERVAALQREGVCKKQQAIYTEPNRFLSAGTAIPAL